MIAKIGSMFLKSGEVIKRIYMVQVAGMDQAHEQITDLRAMFGFKKQTVFAMQYSLFQSPFAKIIYGCLAMHPLKKVIQNTSQ